jgi:leucyl/phenylalanyl-tRNA--protein transferase
MFSLERDASKVALIQLVERLRDGGFLLLDTQMITDHLQTFGAVEIPRAEYHRRLAEALGTRAKFSYPPVYGVGVSEVHDSSQAS